MKSVVLGAVTFLSLLTGGISDCGGGAASGDSGGRSDEARHNRRLLHHHDHRSVWIHDRDGRDYPHDAIDGTGRRTYG